MTARNTETAPLAFRELDASHLESVRGAYAEEVLLNPQPLPPRASLFRSSLSWRALNPQPEPPGSLFSFQR